MTRKSKKQPRRKETPARPTPLRGWEPIGICVFLVILVFGVFGQTAGHGFVNLDDDKYIYDNSMVARGLTLAGLRWALFYGEIGHWHPLTWVVHMLDCQLFGMWAGGHHLTSVALHAAAAVLLFLLLARMTGATWRSGFVAAAWAIHPLRVESVAWVSELKDVLSVLFFMLSAGAYVGYVRQPSRGRYVLIVVLFTLGLLSKNMLVTFPFVLLLLDYWPLGRLNGFPAFYKLVREKVPLFVLSLISCVITFLVPEKVTALERLPLWLRIENAIISCCIYLGQTVWPVGLAAFYPNPTKAYPILEVAGGVALLCLISGAAFALRKSHPSLLVGWLWFIGMLVPVIGLVQIGNDGHADRRLYLPQIGLFIAAAWLAADWAGESRNRRMSLGAVAAAAVSGWSIAAWHQTSYWHDSESLWNHALACLRDNSLAHNNLGNVLLEKGRTEDAVAHYREAIRINPAYEDAYGNLGNALLQEGRIDEAISDFRRALYLNPDDTDAHNNLGYALLQQGGTDEAVAEYRAAIRIDPNYADAHNNLGNALFRQQRRVDAIAEYRETLKINPAYPDARCNLANALLLEGRTEEAIAEYREAVRINPADANACNNLGTALQRQGRLQEAIADYRAAVRANPGYADAQGNLGDALLQQGETGEAIAHMEKALELQPANISAENKLAWVLAAAPQASLRNGAVAVQLAEDASQSAGGNNPLYLRTLAAAYAEAGRYSEAVQSSERALESAEAQGNIAVVKSLRRETALYEAGHPYEDAANGQSR